MTNCIDAAHCVWVNEQDKIVSFHPVDENYNPIGFEEYSSFIAFVLQMTEQHFRFQ